MSRNPNYPQGGAFYEGGMPTEYAKFNTNFQGQKETIGWKWWDTQTYTSGTTIALTGFFMTTRATIDLSNMTAAGTLPASNGFLVRAVRFFVKQRVRATSPTTTGNQVCAFDNIAQLINTGVWQLTIGAKVYNQEPVWCITAGGGACGVMAATGQFAGASLYDYAQNGVPDPQAVNVLSKPLFIPPQQNFSGAVTWPAALTLTGNVDISFLLEGDLIRAVQ